MQLTTQGLASSCSVLLSNAALAPCLDLHAGESWWPDRQRPAAWCWVAPPTWGSDGLQHLRPQSFHSRWQPTWNQKSSHLCQVGCSFSLAFVCKKLQEARLEITLNPVKSALGTVGDTPSKDTAKKLEAVKMSPRRGVAFAVDVKQHSYPDHGSLVVLLPNGTAASAAAPPAQRRMGRTGSFQRKHLLVQAPSKKRQVPSDVVLCR